jgi:hypothetical protein
LRDVSWGRPYPGSAPLTCSRQVHAAPALMRIESAFQGPPDWKENAPPLLGQRGDVVYAYSLVEVYVTENGVKPERAHHLSMRWRGRLFLQRCASKMMNKKKQRPSDAKATRTGEFWQMCRIDLISNSKSILKPNYANWTAQTHDSLNLGRFRRSDAVSKRTMRANEPWRAIPSKAANRCLDVESVENRLILSAANVNRQG